jgi:hypothetical protein
MITRRAVGTKAGTNVTDRALVQGVKNALELGLQHMGAALLIWSAVVSYACCHCALYEAAMAAWRQGRRLAGGRHA